MVRVRRHEALPNIIYRILKITNAIRTSYFYQTNAPHTLIFYGASKFQKKSKQIAWSLPGKLQSILDCFES